MAWRTYGFDVNGLPVAAWYREETVEQVLAPLLARLARSHQEKGSQAHLGNPVRIRYCDRDGHVSRTDIVRQIDTALRKVRLEHMDIPFADVLSVEIIGRSE